MKKFMVSSLDFKNTYANTSENSLAFENVCDTETFDTNKESSRLGIKHWEHALLTTYLPSIIENSSIMDISSDELRRKYSKNPQRLSADIFTITDYWYLILAINNYTSLFEFKDFDRPILVPNSSYIDSIITTLERERKA